MEDGGPERGGGVPCLQVDEGDGAGLSGLLLLHLTARQAPGDGAARGETPETGGGSLGGLARSLQKAEAILRSCVAPSLRWLRPPRPPQRSADGEDEDEELPALLPALEQSFPGLRRCLCVWEDPRTETFRGHVQPGDAAAAFSFQPLWARVAERGASLHALLRHWHLLRLARDYTRLLHASSAFLRRLWALPELPAEDMGTAPPLQELCRELRTHAGHWSGLRRRLHGDPWLRPLLLRRHQAVAHMRRALLVPALHAARVTEHHAEARLRALAHASVTRSLAMLADLFQALDIYNQAVGELATELATGSHEATNAGCHAFAVGRVLEILATERGRMVAERLQPLLLPRWGAEPVCWEDAVLPWPPERGAAADAGPSGREELPGIGAELRALCREDEELMGGVLGVLASSILHGNTLGPPAAETPEPPELPVLGRCLAGAHAACAWVTASARRFLAAWTLPQLLIVTQGDLQLLQTQTDELLVLVSETFPETGDPPPQPPPSPLSHREQQLCRQIRAVAASIQLFSGDVLRLFSSDCKRLSAQIFAQTMPLGKHWRLGPHAAQPSSPSAYARSAAQTVLGQVLQGARLLPRDAQAPTLARATTAFGEAWMDHILARRIKFSLAGALQLRQDFGLVRELVGSERYGLAPETRRSLLDLRIFREMDGAILCLLQQPGGAAGEAPRPWQSLRHCCSDHGAHPPEPDAGVLHDLETLEVAPVGTLGTPPSYPSSAGGGMQDDTPDSCYLPGSQQQWLALRLHRARRWRVPGLPCVGNDAE
ncbi:coiled-coil domain-containing protein 142 [Pterocles gutturalis]